MKSICFFPFPIAATALSTTSWNKYNNQPTHLTCTLRLYEKIESNINLYRKPTSFETHIKAETDLDETNDFEHQRQETIRSLCSSLSLTTKQAVTFLSATSVYDTDVLAKVIYFRNEVGMSKERLRNMILQHPKLVASAFLDEVKTTMDFLQEDLQLSPRQIRSITTTSPSVIRYYRTNLRRNLAFLRGPALSLSEDDLRKVVLKRPQLLGYSLEKLESTTEFYREYLGLYGEMLGKLLQRFPFLLAYSVENNLKPTVILIRDEIFGHHDEVSHRIEATSAVVIKFPQILGYSIENISNKVCPCRNTYHYFNPLTNAVQYPRLPT